jgi:hypothetical protein
VCGDRSMISFSVSRLTTVDAIVLNPFSTLTVRRTLFQTLIFVPDA